MMRFLVFLTAICFSSLSMGLAQDEDTSMNFPIDEKTGYVTYDQVVQQGDVSKERLYKRALDWYRSFFENTSGVIEKKKKNEGIWGQDRFFLWDQNDGRKRRAGIVEYDVVVQVKGGRYKYTITEIFKKQSPQLYIKKWVNYEGPNKETYSNYLEQIYRKVDNLRNDLRETMSESLKEEEDDKW